jgi:uncharacterized protein (TIGR00369 family)
MAGPERRVGRLMKSERNNNQETKFREILNREKPNYYHLVGINILDVKEGYAKLKMDVDVKLTNPYGFVAGGFYAVLADTSLACALLSVTEDTPTRRLVCIEYKVNTIKPVSKGAIISEARVIHLGKAIAIGTVEMRDDADSIVATALITYSVKY